MKNLKKTESGKFDNVAYYSELVNKIGSGIIRSADLYEFIRQNDEKFGRNCTDHSRCTRVTDTLTSILGDKWIEVVKDESVKRIGRSNPRLFSLKLERGNENESLNKIKSDIRSYFLMKEVKSVPKAKSIKEIAVVVPKGKKEKAPRTFTRPKITMVRRLYDVLVKVCRGGKETVPFSKLSEYMDHRFMSQQVLDTWKNSLAEYGFSLDVRVVSIGGNKKAAKFSGVKDIIFSLSKKAVEWYGEDLGAEKELGLFGSIAVKTVEPRKVTVTEKKEVDQDTGYLIYVIGGILKKHGKALDYDDLCKVLRDNFAISTTKVDLRKLANEVPEFDGTIRLNNAIMLKDLDNGWISISEKYDPKNTKLSVIARIGMTTDEVRKFIPEAEVLSVISDTDAIYRLWYNKSIHSFKNLIRLYRTFRGTDTILGNDTLVERMEREIVILDSAGYANNLAYQIETI